MMDGVTFMERPVGATGPADPRTDQELIAAINGGEVEAFGALYHRYRDWVAGQAHRFTGDPDLALDVLQETFLYLLKKFPGFQLTAQMKTFLYPAVRHLSLTARRRTARYQSSPAEQAALETAPGPESAPTDHEALAGVFALLTEEQQETLRLRFVEGFKLEEIAVALGLPLGTVKSRLHYALQTLRQDPRTKNFFGS